MITTFEGSCHCGAVRFTVEADPEQETVVDCNCSICTKKGFLHLIVPPERFRLLSGQDAIREYRFNTGQAVHKFCTTCGIHPFYTPRSHPDMVDVNLRCLDRFATVDWQVEAFDGQNWEESVESIRS